MSLSRRPRVERESFDRLKKQLCFIGFAESELLRLQPSLEATANRWECVHYRSTDDALKAMRETPYDVMIANLSPDGLHDAAFLQNAAIAHPRMIRLVLGDVADREMVVGCMGAAHQFISKPWKPPELISIIERSLALDSWLSSDSLRLFIPRLGTLPGLPSTYFEVLKKAESPNCTVESIADVIARDPSLTARLLQMVNSPASGLKEKITSPADAVSMMGIDAVKSLVLCLQLFSQTSPADAAGLSLDRLWHHSFMVAKTAAKVVLRCIASERMASEAYTAGLLHNIGQIVMATNLSGEYSAVVLYARENKCTLQDAEIKLLGVTSNQVGAYLLGVWGMPLAVLESTALHLNPSSVQPPEFSLLTAVHVANVLAWDEDSGDLKFQLPKLDSDYLRTMEMPRKPDAWRKFLAEGPSQEKIQAPRPAPTLVEPPPPVRAKPIKVKDEAETRPSNKPSFFFIGLIVLAVLGLVAKNRYFPGHASEAGDNTEPKPAGSNSANPAPDAPAAQQRKPAEPDPVDFDMIKLQGIIYMRRNPVALVNGKTVAPGDMLGAVKIVSMTTNSVVMSCKGVQKTFFLK